MKRLLLLRHARANPGFPDRNRVLAPAGLADAEALGTELKNQNQLPDLVLASNATRTHQTASAMTDEARIHLVPELYQAGSDEILALIRTLACDAEALMVVAHNPGIGVLARILAQKQAARCDAFPPCTLAEFTVHIADWQTLSYTDCKLESIRFAGA